MREWLPGTIPGVVVPGETLMSLVLLLARLLLAGVFGVAGFANLANLTRSRQALRDFGVPGRLSSPFGVLLPLIELAVAVALVQSASQPKLNVRRMVSA